MPFPKITEGVMGVLKNPQKEAENGCNRCKDYITSITPINLHLLIRKKLNSFT